ncbi:MAG: efflux RND transporter periplasmic adaptor subunit [Gemmatimonadota bacterium]
MRITRLFAFVLLAVAACKKEETAPPAVYQAVPVTRRDVVVSAQASGAVQPDTTVEVKSKASGEILQIRVETGQQVQRGALMVNIDPRTAQNTMAQTQAEFEVARATLGNARSQKRRADELFQSQSITESEHETAQLTYANAIADSVRAVVALENARIRLEDTDVRAPITGIIIEKDVERGQVISSPTNDVGGGTVLLRMADLGLVQIRTLVDETDIGKIKPGLLATVTVDAFPNRPFEGTVLKVEPLAVVQQNVTMFPVLIRIENREGLLRPGMNAEVEIHVGRRDQVLAIPNAALRTTRDVGSAATVLGLDPKTVETQLASAPATRQDSMGASSGGPGGTPAGSRPGADSAKKPAGNTMTLPDGRSIPLPAGVTEAQIQAIMKKRMSGGQVTAEESALLRKVFAGMSGGGRGRQAQTNDYQFGGRYIVFVLRDGKPFAVNVRTGLTDLDYSEVVEGLSESDSVLVLPSASLVASQDEWRERMQRVTGSGSMGGMRQAPATTGSTTPSTGARP